VGGLIGGMLGVRCLGGCGAVFGWLLFVKWFAVMGVWLVFGAGCCGVTRLRKGWWPGGASRLRGGESDG